MNLSLKELGQYLQSLRESKELSTRDVHSLCGVSSGYLSLVENGHRRASAVVLKKLAPIYGVNYIELYEKAGYIDLIDDEKKTKIKYDQLGNPSMTIPLLGTVKAGYDHVVQEEIIGEELIDVNLAKTGEFFALTVKNNSMFPDFRDGDIVIVQRQNFAEDNDVVIALINGEEDTIKEFKSIPGGMMLKPYNREYEDLIFTEEEIKTKPVIIIGKVRECRRKYK